MSNNMKYLNFGAGWVKQNKNGKQYISMVLGDKQNNLKVILRNAQGEEMEVTSCMVAFQENKRNEKAPDVRITLKIDE